MSKVMMRLMVFASVALLATGVQAAVSVYESFGDAVNGTTLDGYSSTNPALETGFAPASTWTLLAGSGNQDLSEENAGYLESVAGGHANEENGGKQHMWRLTGGWGGERRATRPLATSIDLTTDGVLWMSFLTKTSMWSNGDDNYSGQIGLANATSELIFGNAFGDGLTAYYGPLDTDARTNTDGTRRSDADKEDTFIFLAKIAKKGADVTVSIRAYNLSDNSGVLEPSQLVWDRVVTLAGVSDTFDTLKLKLNGSNGNGPMIDEVRVGDTIEDVTGYTFTGPTFVEAGADLYTSLSLAQAGIDLSPFFFDPNNNTPATNNVAWSILTDDMFYVAGGAVTPSNEMDAVFTASALGRYLVKLEVLDPDADTEGGTIEDPNMIDYLEILVVGTDCETAKKNPNGYVANAKDFSDDCIVNLLDFAGKTAVDGDDPATPALEAYDGFALEWGKDNSVSGGGTVLAGNDNAVALAKSETILGDQDVQADDAGDSNTDCVINIEAAYENALDGGPAESVEIKEFYFYADDGITDSVKIQPFVALKHFSGTPALGASQTLADPNENFNDSYQYEEAFTVLAVGTERTDFTPGENVYDFFDGAIKSVSIPDGNSIVIGFTSTNIGNGSANKRTVAYDDDGTTVVWRASQNDGNNDWAGAGGGEGGFINVYWVNGDTDYGANGSIEYIQRDYQFAIGIGAITATDRTVANAGEDLVTTVLDSTTGLLLNGSWVDTTGTAADILWSITSGPAANDGALADAATTTPVFTATVPGDYVVELQVRDLGGTPLASDSLTISIKSDCDVAKAEEDFVQNPMDFNADCVVDVTDLGDLAQQWLSNTYLSETVEHTDGDYSIRTGLSALGTSFDASDIQMTTQYSNHTVNWIVNLTDTFTNYSASPVTLNLGNVKLGIPNVYNNAANSMRFIPFIVKVNFFEQTPNVLKFNGVNWWNNYDTDFTVKAKGTARMTNNKLGTPGYGIDQDLAKMAVNTFAFNDGAAGVEGETSVTVNPGETIAIGFCDGIGGDDVALASQDGDNRVGGYGPCVGYINKNDPQAALTRRTWSPKNTRGDLAPDDVGMVVGEHPNPSPILGGGGRDGAFPETILPESDRVEFENRDYLVEIELTVAP